MLVPDWPRAYGGCVGKGCIRSVPEDFIVREILPFEPSGSGEHAFLLLEKKGENTEYVARQLARIAGVRQRDIGVAGLKDRHAVTTQWFSVWLPGQADPDWEALESDTIHIKQCVRHARKLKRGALAGNSFEITVRDWMGDAAVTEAKLELIKAQGLPNYFGEQRFGQQGQNVTKALALFKGERCKREQRSIYLSAARSYLFNRILARRILVNNWHQAIAGDILSFDDSHSYFHAAEIDDAIKRRINAGELHPTGALWGKGSPEVTHEALALERDELKDCDELTLGLVASGLEMNRRALRVFAKDLQWQFSDQQLQLRFTLPAGSYATALLREIVEI